MAKPAQPPPPTGTLTIPRAIAERWLPWFEEQVAEFKSIKQIGDDGFISQICKAARTKWNTIGDAKEIVFKNMTPELVRCLTDFHRRAYGHSDAPIFYALGAGWRGPGQVDEPMPELTPERRAELDAEAKKPIPTWEESNRAAEEAERLRAEAKPVGSLF